MSKAISSCLSPSSLLHRHTLNSAHPDLRSLIPQLSCFSLVFPRASLSFWCHCHVHFCALRTQIPISSSHRHDGSADLAFVPISRFRLPVAPHRSLLFPADLRLSNPLHSPEVHSSQILSERTKTPVTIHMLGAL